MEAKKKPPTPVAKTTVRIKVKAPATRIHHCYTGVVFTETPVELDELDSWTRSQVEAGKLELC